MITCVEWCYEVKGQRILAKNNESFNLDWSVWQWILYFKVSSDFGIETKCMVNIDFFLFP